MGPALLLSNWLASWLAVCRTRVRHASVHVGFKYRRSYGLGISPRTARIPVAFTQREAFRYSPKGGFDATVTGYGAT